MEKLYTPKCVQEKTKIDLFRDFLQEPPNYEFVYSVETLTGIKFIRI
jgi:hypothetical protein